MSLFRDCLISAAFVLTITLAIYIPFFAFVYWYKGGLPPDALFVFAAMVVGFPLAAAIGTFTGHHASKRELADMRRRNDPTGKILGPILDR